MNGFKMANIKTIVPSEWKFHTFVRFHAIHIGYLDKLQPLNNSIESSSCKISCTRNKCLDI